MRFSTSETVLPRGKVALTCLAGLSTASPGQTLKSPSNASHYSVGMENYQFQIPAATDLHRGTIMSWPTARSILNTTWSYPGSDVSATRQELAALAQAIAKYEPVNVFVLDPKLDSSVIDGTNDSSHDSASLLLENVRNVTLNLIPNVDSLWARDTGPVFVNAKQSNKASKRVPKMESSVAVGVILGFNQWGQKNLPTVDSYFASSACQILDRCAFVAPFVAEGGGIEVDGEGTLIATESAILNPNRNPGIDKTTMEGYFFDIFGVKKTIWIPGAAGEDVTDDHIDGVVRFAPDGVVLVSKPFVPFGADEDEYLADYYDTVDALSGQTNAKGKPFVIVDLPEPDVTVLGLSRQTLEESGASVAYVNFHVVNGAVILAKFGDEKADNRAAKIVAKYYPNRVIEQVPLRQLAIQGGGIHCATQEYH